VVVATTLTACVPQSRDSLDQWVGALDEIDGVSIDSYSVSTPLPFSVNGTVDVSFDADAATLAELQRVGCETEVNASVYLSITAREGEASVRLGSVDLCDDLSLDIVALARATASFGLALSIDDVADSRLSVDDAEDLAESIAVLRAAVDFLPAGPVQLSGEDLVVKVADAGLAAGYLDDFAALVAAFGIAEIDLEDGSLVIQAESASDSDAVKTFLAARDASRYSDLAIVVTDAASGDVPSGTDAVVIALRDRIVAELGLSVNIGGDVVYVQARDSDEVVDLGERIAAINPDEVRVGITILGDEDAGIPEFRVGDDPQLTPSNNPYPTWVDQFDELVSTGFVGTVEVGPDSLMAWLTDDDYDDPDAFAAVRKVLDALAAEYDLTYWELNNRDITQ
jgi:hypothetical protein